MPEQESPSLDVHLDAEDLAEQMSHDVREGLGSEPKTLLPKYFYDARGSELFDEITRLPEYYPTRTEASILLRHAPEIAEISGAEVLVELGSGTSEKTRVLLDALTALATGTLRTFVPFDVDPVILEQAAAQITREFPGIAVEPIVGDFEQHLGSLPDESPKMIAFLGSTLGNLDPAQRTAFLSDLRAQMQPRDSFLVGIDMVKSPVRLVRAYDDAAGVTAEFNRNVLAVINSSLGADFDLTAFDHEARWNEAEERVEMHLVSTKHQHVTVAELGLEVEFTAGESMRTEISSKFRRQRIEDELDQAGLRLAHWWTDPDGDFAVLLATPAGEPDPRG